MNMISDRRKQVRYNVAKFRLIKAHFHITSIFFLTHLVITSSRYSDICSKTYFTTHTPAPHCPRNSIWFVFGKGLLTKRYFKSGHQKTTIILTPWHSFFFFFYDQNLSPVLLVCHPPTTHITVFLWGSRKKYKDDRDWIWFTRSQDLEGFKGIIEIGRGQRTTFERMT